MSSGLKFGLLPLGDAKVSGIPQFSHVEEDSKKKIESRLEF